MQTSAFLHYWEVLWLPNVKGLEEEKERGGADVQQGGPQMSENGEKIIALNFRHLKSTLKLPKNTVFENIDSTYSP